jgi:RimJ/RimL family protein N-acetyltransferase
MKKKKNKIDFRPINENDTDEIYELLNELTDQAKYFFHPHLFDKKTIEAICISKKDHYFVMTMNGNIIGYSMLRLFGYEIPSFGCCIRTGYIGKGYGLMLTSWTVETAKELGYKKVILKVHNENTIAFQMYKKIGFTVVGEIPEKHEIKMEKPLIQ